MNTIRALLLAVTVAALTLVGACGSSSHASSSPSAHPGSSPASSGALKTFTSTAFHFSVSYDPSSVKVAQTAKKGGLSVFTFAARSGKEYVRISAITVPDAAGMLNGEMTVMKSEGQVKPASLAGMKGYTVAVPIAGYSEEQAAFVHGHELFAVYVVFESNLASTWGPKLVAIEKSFRLTQ
jgi:hypothetical protein